MYVATRPERRKSKPIEKKLTMNVILDEDGNYLINNAQPTKEITINGTDIHIYKLSDMSVYYGFEELTEHIMESKEEE